MIDILVNGADPASIPVSLLDNGMATINTDIAEQLGYDYDALVEAFTPYCTGIESVTLSDEAAE